MRSLPSSGYNEIERTKRSLVVELVKKSSGFYRAIKDVRERWGIEARRGVPEKIATPTAVHFPLNAPERVDNPHIEGWEKWVLFTGGWTGELHGLYYEHIPESARFHPDMLSREWWRVFLSACLVFNPPQDALEAFADSHPQIMVGLADDETPYAMARPPIVQGLRQEEVSELKKAYDVYAVELAVWVGHRMKEHPDADLDEVLIQALGEASVRAPLEDVTSWHHRSFIEPQPWHTEKDVLNAARMFAATQEPKPGRRGRDPLRAVQCAILHDRLGWHYEEIERAYGWNAGSNAAGKYIAAGRGILAR